MGLQAAQQLSSTPVHLYTLALTPFPYTRHPHPRSPRAIHTLLCHAHTTPACLCSCRDRATGELLAVKLMKRPIPKVCVWAGGGRGWT